ncbi:MAG: bactoprenol glucosyl transferase [Epulopiscium sp. Nuni2H_MBin001]|nr:MAG: bactoprenol glucosyl transferase [Epulopiscium sp. Nuni2H_MBin001]
MKLISIVVPCYNEQETVEIFYKEIIKVINELPDYGFEIVYINDGSKDNTAEYIYKLTKLDSRIAFIDLSRNFGKEAGLLAGLQYAKGDAVVVMDVDLQDPPNLLPELISNWEKGHDIVYTRRTNRDGEPLIRSWFAKLFYKLINKLSDVEIVDGARDYRIMDRRVVNSLLDLGEKNRFSKGLFMWVGYDCKCIEFQHVERVAGETSWSFWKLFGYAIDGIVSFTNFPLKIASIFGIIVSLLSFIFLIYVVIKNTIFENPVSGWASMTSIICFLGGIQLIVIGVIGEYVGKVFNEVKARPQYIVKDYIESSFNKGEQNEN